MNVQYRPRSYTPCIMSKRPDWSVSTPELLSLLAYRGFTYRGFQLLRTTCQLVIPSTRADAASSGPGRDPVAHPRWHRRATELRRRHRLEVDLVMAAACRPGYHCCLTVPTTQL